jgi:hypothetical protein
MPRSPKKPHAKNPRAVVWSAAGVTALTRPLCARELGGIHAKRSRWQVRNNAALK